MNWEIDRTNGTAHSFHQRIPQPGTGPEVWIHRIDRPALVLGSTQPDDLVNSKLAAADGIEVCRRRSGGGLVWINQRTDCWVDVIVPADSPLWHSDIGVAFHWLGTAWAESLLHFGIETEMARTSTSSPAGAIWCFADLGHGELSIAGSKVLGLSQRRTRDWIRLQGLLLGSWPGVALTRYVDPEAMVRHRPRLFNQQHSPAEFAPERVTAGFPDHVELPDRDQLIERLLATLPAPSSHRF